MGWTLDQFVRRNALRYPNKPGIVMGDSVRTWQETDRRVDRVANALRAAGQGPQNRVAILLRNRLEYPEVLFGASRAGLIALTAQLQADRAGTVRDRVYRRARGSS